MKSFNVLIECVVNDDPGLNLFVLRRVDGQVIEYSATVNFLVDKINELVNKVSEVNIDKHEKC